MRRPARLALASGLLALAAGAPAAEPVTAGFHAAPPASDAAPAAARARHAARAPVPAANFLVEWRVQPADARPSPRGDVVITSGSAATGTSGFGGNAVVVGTARPAAPQALRVANGREGAIVFDRSETHTVYDMAWTASARASASTDGSAQVVLGAASSVTAIGGSRSAARSDESGVQDHEVVVHRVDGLRVTPRWTRGDALELDLALTHVAPTSVSRNATAGARASRDVDFHSTVRASFDEWLTVATVGDGGDELQIRVTRR
ncbi:MAG TPA: hypothetical protein VES00_16945 [Burkholderiaceae bacterium]|jgi:hypothetical protein|nr:hypothetical protein [Burkholderiaceae bacterium]